MIVITIYDILMYPLRGEWILGRMMRSQSVRRAFLIGCLLHMFQQLAGINTGIFYESFPNFKCY